MAKMCQLTTTEVNMKKLAICATIFLFFLFFTAIGFAQEDVKKHPSCKYCGMDREKFAYSRVLIEYEDGTAEGMCSLRCAAVDLTINLDKSPKVIRVGDYGTKTLIDAEKAFWGIGGRKMGAMTKRGK